MDQLPKLIKSRIEEDLSPVHVPNAMEMINSSLEESKNRISDILKPIFDFISATMIKKSTDGLLPLRGIAATYRMTNKPVPTQPSFYVDQILTPLNDFVRETSGFLSAESIGKWKIEVVQATIAK
jgi:conserved oligomeric Golgi complex subunit 2